MKNTINWRGDHCLDYCGPHDYNTFNAINRYGQSDNRAKWGGWVNDCHSQLNRTKVSKILRPLSRVELIRIVNDARKSGRSVMPFGGKHAMGSQQFGSGTLAIDMRGLNKVLSLEQKTGILEVEAGICWPEIMAFLETPRASHGKHAGNHGWSIAQKQTGADELTLGGALAANIHGRGLNKRPIIEDVQSFTLINAEGRFRECSRSQNEDLFKLVIGGYGLFGLIYSVRIQLIS